MKQFEKTMKPFEVRSYTKKELALAYFPDVTDPHIATNRLMRWIVRNTELMEELRKHGYQKNFRFFTPAQVRLIVYYLGEP
ncbi:MAG: DUF4248 domain-containing protein [Prevotella sp.]|jgi:hypothetical protein|uniref:DUF4248 domain-containing protein n=1 Tax=Prevotella sp. TaxID=59823 RepID=UPI00258C627D|nr:DUF4248 domain-containing protein [Prevotella sp.]MDD5821883.1 DUF4248 domain-containing protein [Prevotella sp.]MDD6852736.1 DUF4248 domain-containing protein [Prevotella sp.]